MKTYIVEMTTEYNFHALMTGSAPLGVPVLEVEVEAETAEEALAKAKAANPDLIANDGYVKTTEELAAIKAEEAALWQAIREEQAAKKGRKETREAEKATAMNLTVQEYRKYKRHKALTKKVPNEIAELEAEIERKKEYLAKLLAEVAEIEGV